MIIESLQIGITDYCNLGCIMCGQHAHEGYGHPGGLGPAPFHQDQKGFMKPELLEMIIDGIIRDGFRFDVLNFYWFGEQLLHPNFAEMLDFIVDANRNNRFFNRLWINTNGTLLSGERLEAIFRAASNKRMRPGTFERLYLSIDSASPETFLRIKRQDSYNRVIDNAEKFLDKRGSEPYPRLVAGFIIMPENSDEAGVFRTDWENRFKTFNLPFSVDYNAPDLSASDSIFFKVCYLPIQAEMESLHNKVLQDLDIMNNGSDDEAQKTIAEDFSHDEEITTNNVSQQNNLPVNEKEDVEGIKRETDMMLIGEDFKLSPEDAARRLPCPALFRTPTINWDGRLAVCCSDYAMEVELPSLSEISFKDAWEGKAYQRLRKIHCAGRFDEIPRCLACGNLDTLKVTDEELNHFGLEITERKK